jgi:hypothetical protein
MAYSEPVYALVDAYDPLDQREGFIIEHFDATVHLSSYGWAKPGVVPFTDISEVEHLRDYILN